MTSGEYCRWMLRTRQARLSGPFNPPPFKTREVNPELNGRTGAIVDTARERWLCERERIGGAGKRLRVG